MAQLKDTSINGDLEVTGNLSIPNHSNVATDLDKLNSLSQNDIWETIGTYIDRTKIFIDQNKYKTIFCELRVYDQYAQMTFPVRYIDEIPTNIEKSFCVGGYQTSQYPGIWIDIKCGKMGSEQPYIYFNRGFVNGYELDYNSGVIGISVWGEKFL